MVWYGAKFVLLFTPGVTVATVPYGLEPIFGKCNMM